MTKPLKNILTDWSAYDVKGDGLRIRGVSVYDQEGVVEAGEIFVTSLVESITMRHCWVEAVTRNSTYLLIVEPIHD